MVELKQKRFVRIFLGLGHAWLIFGKGRLLVGAH
jgi:hypothetical protein